MVSWSGPMEASTTACGRTTDVATRLRSGCGTTSSRAVCLDSTLSPLRSMVESSESSCDGGSRYHEAARLHAGLAGDAWQQHCAGADADGALARSTFPGLLA